MNEYLNIILGVILGTIIIKCVCEIGYSKSSADTYNYCTEQLKRFYGKDNK